MLPGTFGLVVAVPVSNSVDVGELIGLAQPPPQALRFSHGRGERETSDW